NKSRQSQSMSRTHLCSGGSDVDCHRPEHPVQSAHVVCGSQRLPDCIGGRKKNAVTNKNRIVIYGPKPDDTYVIEFETADGQTLAISMPHGEWAVLKYFQERMPYGLFVPDIS